MSRRRFPTGGPQYDMPPGRHSLAAVDLGKHKVGVALFEISAEGKSVLTYADTLVTKGDEYAVAKAVFEWYLKRASPRRVWVCEYPTVYKSFRVASKDIKSLHNVHAALKLQGVSWAGEYAPAVWKGNVDKTEHHARIQRALSVEEQEVFDDLNHDGKDAVGIGLFALGRTLTGGK